jgi:ferredoxin-NADP reductase
VTDRPPGPSPTEPAAPPDLAEPTSPTEPAAPPARRGWLTATVVGVRDETARAKTFRLRLPEPSGHLAGQHYVVRLTAPDGYTASRSYSVASAPDRSNELEFTVERLEEGEVSTFLHDVVEPGDELEVRGPIGRFFVWDGESPALLVGGGSGVVPLMAMLRHARRTGKASRVRLVVSVRSPAELLYADELPGPETTVVHTREVAPGESRPPGRIALADLAPAVAAVGPDALAFVCGSAGFCDTVTDLLRQAGVPVGHIRVERFGPTR